MKRILTVQDLSCLGKCSLTLALPILSVMGVETAVLPTAVLSTHTAFPGPAVCDLSAQVRPIAEHWKAVGAEFDGIYVGYLGSAKLVEDVQQLAKEFSPRLLVVDPVMGDHGKLYSGFDVSYAEKMRQLCAIADVILPNLTEACLLADMPYTPQPDEDFVRKLLERLSALGCKTVVLTGIGATPEQTGVAAVRNGVFWNVRVPKLPQSYHGTGDIFASVCAGGLVLELPLEKVLTAAAEFTSRCIAETMTQTRDSRYGVCFEAVLPALKALLA